MLASCLILVLLSANSQYLAWHKLNSVEHCLQCWFGICDNSPRAIDTYSQPSLELSFISQMCDGSTTHSGIFLQHAAECQALTINRSGNHLRDCTSPWGLFCLTSLSADKVHLVVLKLIFANVALHSVRWALVTWWDVDHVQIMYAVSTCCNHLRGRSMRQESYLSKHLSIFCCVFGIFADYSLDGCACFFVQSLKL